MDTPTTRDISLLLVGRDGSGKSATGNSILGDKFFHSTSGSLSEEVNITTASTKYEDGSKISVTEIAGLEFLGQGYSGDNVEAMAYIEKTTFNKQEEGNKKENKDIKVEGGNEKEKEDIKQEFNAVILVLKFGLRHTQQEKDAIKMIKSVFGDNILKDYGVIVMTCGDCFDADMEEDGQTFVEWCQKQKGDIQNLFTECEYRCVLFNNRAKTEDKIKAQREQLLKIVTEMIDAHNGRRYTLDQYREAAMGRTRILVQAKLRELEKDTKKVLDEVRNKLNEIDKDMAEDSYSTCKLETALRYLRLKLDKLKTQLKDEDEDSGVCNHLFTETTVIEMRVQLKTDIWRQKLDARRSVPPQENGPQDNDGDTDVTTADLSLQVVSETISLVIFSSNGTKHHKSDSSRSTKGGRTPNRGVVLLAIHKTFPASQEEGKKSEVKQAVDDKFDNGSNVKQSVVDKVDNGSNVKQAVADEVDNGSNVKQLVVDKVDDGSNVTQSVVDKVNNGSNVKQAVADEVDNGSNVKQSVVDKVDNGSNVKQAVADKVDNGSNIKQSIVDKVDNGSNVKQAVADEVDNGSNVKQSVVDKVDDGSNVTQSVVDKVDNGSNVKQAVADKVDNGSNVKQSVVDKVDDGSNVTQSVVDKVDNGSNVKQAVVDKVDDGSNVKQSVTNEVENGSNVKQAVEDKVDDGSKNGNKVIVAHDCENVTDGGPVDKNLHQIPHLQNTQETFNTLRKYLKPYNFPAAVCVVLKYGTQVSKEEMEKVVRRITSEYNMDHSVLIITFDGDHRELEIDEDIRKRCRAETRIYWHLLEMCGNRYVVLNPAMKDPQRMKDQQCLLAASIEDTQVAVGWEHISKKSVTGVHNVNKGSEGAATESSGFFKRAWNWLRR